MKDLVPLYGCTPIGAGTPLTESLTSLIGRLAVARSLMPSVISERLVRPLVPEGLKEESFWRNRLCGQNSLAWDNHADFTAVLVDVLAELTDLDGLSFHTLLPWRRLFAAQHGRVLSSRHRRWCASCLAGWHANGVEPWEPLLWRVGVVRRCPVHRTPLSEVCPRCKSSQGFMPGVVPFGICRWCGHDLEIDDPMRTRRAARLTGSVKRWEWEVAQAVGRLLAAQEEMAAFASPRGFLTLLERIRNRVDSHSLLGLSRYIGANQASVKNWMDGKRLWCFGSFIQVCMRVGVDPLAVAVFPHRDFSVPERSERELRLGAPRLARQAGSRSPSCRYWEPARWRQAEKQLAEILEGPEPGQFSVVAVTRLLGITPGALQKRYPEVYVRIRDLHAAYRKRMREERLARREARLREAFLACVQEGVYPSKDVVFRRAGLPPMYSVNLEDRSIWRRLRYEFGLEIG